jgi:flagellar basal-body rod modification protein FlgD
MGELGLKQTIMPDPITSATSTAANTAADLAPTRAPGNTLTQNDFLKLLIAQMTAQDPLNPQSNTDFAAQMAQFTALQSSQSTQAGVSSLQASQQVQQANSLIGRSVSLLSSNGSLSTGVVTGVQMDSGVPKLVVNGSNYDLSEVFSISTPSANTAAAPKTHSPLM